MLTTRTINKEEYVALEKGVGTPLTQCSFYGERQEAEGRRVLRYLVEKGGRAFAFFQVIKFDLPFNKSYLYIPHGPVFLATTENVTRELAAVKRILSDITRDEGAVFLRFDPFFVEAGANWESDSQVGVGLPSQAAGEWKANFIHPSPGQYSASLQPKFEWVLDLAPSEAELLTGMVKVNRYTIKQAEKLGVKVEIISSGKLEFKKDYDEFLRLARATADRDGFNAYGETYYKNVFDSCVKNQNGFLAVGRVGEEIAIIDLFVIYGKSAYYLLSGADDKHRKLGCSYRAIWEAITYAKSIDLHYLNFGGVKPEGALDYPAYKKWGGFTDFKRRFGGFLLEYTDFYDVVNSTFWYCLFSFKKTVSGWLK